jgi:ribonuclease P/MRP protein subunit RPP40
MIGPLASILTCVPIQSTSTSPDSIALSKLLFKLELYGITGKLLDWIRSFLSNRLQCVVIDRLHSEFSPVISGVPQGSVLGSILFIIYINDIHTVYSGDTALLLFADYAKLYSSVTLGNATVSLQHLLGRLVQWANDRLAAHCKHT